ncbi:MAG: hypothetical protein IPM24_11625 [Bryobacterales bacterium]|nr:hypothetical protein [Bryobacterales bacterium]
MVRCLLSLALLAILVVAPCLPCAIVTQAREHTCCPPKVDNHCGKSEQEPEAECGRTSWAAEQVTAPEAAPLAVIAPAPEPFVRIVSASFAPVTEQRSGAPPGLLLDTLSALLI